MHSSFALFGPPHLVAIGLTATLPVVLGLAWRRNPFAGVFVRYGLVALIVFNKLALLAHSWRLGNLSISNLLPMHLCDWAAIACILALITLRFRLFELAYFWGLAGTLQALLTPDLASGFPDFYFISFFVSHGGIIIAALVLVIGAGLWPTWGSWLRAIIWTQVYLIAAFAVNLALGTNYGYVMHKPFSASILDYFAPWPWYLLQLELVMLVKFTLLMLPFILLRRAGLQKKGQVHFPNDVGQ